jgi:hypothetical protein
MIIAALAVIMVSLVGIASMTGVLPRVGDARSNSEAIHQQSVKDSASPSESGPAEKQQQLLRTLPTPYPSTLAACSRPAAPARTVAVISDYRFARLRVACDAA